MLKELKVAKYYSPYVSCATESSTTYSQIQYKFLNFGFRPKFNLNSVENQVLTVQLSFGLRLKFWSLVLAKDKVTHCLITFNANEYGYLWSPYM